MVSLRYVAIMTLLLLALLFLQYCLWWESGGLRDFFKLKKDLTFQQIDNLRFRQRNDELLFQIERLRHSQEAIEAKARNELGMIKKGQTFYQIVKQDRHENFSQ